MVWYIARLGITAMRRLRVARPPAILVLMLQGREVHSSARTARLVLSTTGIWVWRADAGTGH